VSYKNTVELFSLLSAFIGVNAALPELFGVIYSTTTLVIVSSVFYVISLIISCPISANIKKAFAYSLGSLAMWFGFLLFMFAVGSGVNGKLEFFTLYMLFLLVSSLICAFSGVFVKIVWGAGNV